MDYLGEPAKTVLVCQSCCLAVRPRHVGYSQPHPPLYACVLAMNHCIGAFTTGKQAGQSAPLHQSYLGQVEPLDSLPEVVL
jgi:hypothetical protein